MVAAAVLTAVAWLLPLNGVWRALAFVPPYLLVGGDVVWGALRRIVRGQVFDEKFLMTVATLGAFAIGEYAEAAGVMLFYQVGEWFQSLAVGKSRRSIAALMDIRPDRAVVLRDGEEQTVAPEEVAAGDTLVVRAGEKIPLDGEVVWGQTTVDTAALTGESLPVDKAVGDTVLSGSINLSGVIHVRASGVYAESTVARILELVENAAGKKARVENFITRFARWYTPCVVIGAVLLALLPPLLAGAPWAVWIERALIVLMVSCPCALVVSVPLTFFGGIGGASRDGILVKGATDLEALARVDTVVMDKTGTLTHGRFAVADIVPSDGVSREELLDIAAVAESGSRHPLATPILAAYGAPIDPDRVSAAEELAGHGLRAVVDGAVCYVGNAALMSTAGVAAPTADAIGTVVHAAREGVYLGHLVLRDEVKSDAAEVLARLKTLGITKTVMLTGDSEATAVAVARAVGIDEVHAGLLPAQKVEAVERLLADGRRVAFVGDGINDAPVLARADVGLAMGAMGSDAAIESADIVLMDDRLEKLPRAVRLARKTVGIVRQNIVFALAVKAVVLLLGALGIANMWTAVFGDVGVMVLAIANAMRAMRRLKTQ